VDELEKEQAGLLASYGGKSLHAQSHGEAFMALLTERFRGTGLYILDEPEAALSPVRQMAVLPLLQTLVRKDSQFIIATHSPVIMAFPHATIYVLTEDGITQTPYKETAHYKVARDFLLRTDSMLAELLSE
jgi:predicted ATPase